MNSSEKNPMLTECRVPPALSDEDLLSALDNGATTQVLMHLDACVFCSNRLEDMHTFENSLHQMMHRVDCPAPDQLADYILGTLMMSDNAGLEAHLQGCVRCHEEVKNLRAFFGPSEEKQVPARSQESAWEQVKDLFQSLEHQIVRILTPQPLPAYGILKGTQDGRTRKLVYTSEPVSVMLSLEKVIEGLKINGSILDSGGTGQWSHGHVEFISVSDVRPPYLAMIDDDEMFVIDSVVPGRFNLNIYAVSGKILRLQDVEIEIQL